MYPLVRINTIINRSDLYRFWAQVGGHATKHDPIDSPIRQSSWMYWRRSASVEMWWPEEDGVCATQYGFNRVLY